MKQNVFYWLCRKKSSIFIEFFSKIQKFFAAWYNSR